MKYHIWTSGCQMNVGDSMRLASALEELGYLPTSDPAAADVIVLNTCVVRQSAEQRAMGRLHSLRPLKERRPDLIINLMGCLVGIKGNPALKETFPFVDVFSPPSDCRPLLEYLARRHACAADAMQAIQPSTALEAIPLLPRSARGQIVSAYVPIVLGCSHACAYCIIPSRRGGERSRALPEIASEVEALARQGVREVTLLGQIVDRYGGDLPQRTTLSSLLRHISAVEGIQRIRFLTSHPNWMNDELLETVASLPKVCEHVEVPVQSGDDEVLRRMRRGYTVAQYRGLVEKIRAALPGASIATDVIVGFPAESEAQFQHTRQLLADLRMDVVHLARYSSRPGTLAARKMNDDAPGEEKERRFRILERLQEQIASEINATYLGKSVEVLVTAKQGARWKGRTRTNKLVFVEAGADLLGQLVMVHITWTGAWSMIGRLAEANPKRTSGGTPHNAP